MRPSTKANLKLTTYIAGCLAVVVGCAVALYLLIALGTAPMLDVRADICRDKCARACPDGDDACTSFCLGQCGGR